MKLYKFFKRISIFMLIITFIYIGNKFKDYGSQEEVKEVSIARKKIESIMYERIGAEKGVYSYEESTQKNKMLYRLSSEYYYADKDVGLIFEEDENVSGIYMADSIYKDNESKTLILKDYVPISYGKRFADDIVFFAENINDNRVKVFCRYNLATEKIDTKEVSIFSNADIKDIEFIDINNVIYSKKLIAIKNSIFQSYSYNVRGNEETKTTDSDSEVVSSIISNEKDKTAYIKKDKYTYNLYVYDINSKKTTQIKLKEPIVGGSIVWSPDDKYLLCTTLNKGYKDKLNIIDLESGKIDLINGIYNAIFSNDGKSIIGAAYEKDQSLQCIYSFNIKSKEKKIIYSFFESGNFSRSIKLLEHTSI
ncbi:hypothetical protein [Clostridium cylindrosporum]|uniref:Protein TolB n=1 Tax=Clostridium cylindrosporum DSM 605 TaxID=1121307 RepID=A0A0J8DB27_CLOCY|nr:hypothetical protein [Clostridium cylindrosporum]KMT23280.1 hypothetical protein CLCY_8c00160 [Clostridium cylindrosporum DSM 605]